MDSRNCRLVMIWKSDLPRLNFTGLKGYYSIDPASPTAIVYIESYRTLIKLKEMADRTSPASEATATARPSRESNFESIVRDIGVKKKAP